MLHQRFFTIFIQALLIPIVLSAPLSASELIKVSSHYMPPWTNEDCTGVGMDVVRQAFQEVGLEIDCDISLQKRHIATFLRKRADFAVPFPKELAPENGLFFSKGFLEFVDVAASFRPGPVDLEGLGGSYVVTYQNARNIISDEFKKMADGNPRYLEIPTRENQIKMLHFERSDYVVGERSILVTLARNMFPKDKLEINLILKKWDLGAAAHDKRVMDKFSTGLAILEEKGQIEKIYRQYGIPYSGQASN